jgi:gliding motility associated protien GldN
MMKKVSLYVLLAGLSTAAFSQPDEQQYNPNSIDPIALYEQHYKVRLWRQVDLLEKQNKGFFAVNGEVTRLVLDLIKAGELDVYKDDSLNSKSTKEEAINTLVRSESITYPAWDPASSYYQSDIVAFNGTNYEAQADNTGVNPADSPNGEWAATQQGKALSFEARDVVRLWIKEDLIFDKRRSRLYYDIQSIQLWVFDDVQGFFKPVGIVRYKDIEAKFRQYPQKAVWFNRQNTAQNKNFADAFLLRLFHGYIVKVENPDDIDIIGMIQASMGEKFTRMDGVAEIYRQENLLMEKEHNLWEY